MIASRSDHIKAFDTMFAIDGLFVQTHKRNWSSHAEAIKWAAENQLITQLEVDLVCRKFDAVITN